MKRFLLLSLLFTCSTFGSQKVLLCVEYQGFPAKELSGVQSLHEIFINKVDLLSNNAVSFIVPKTGDSLFCAMEPSNDLRTKYGAASALSFKVIATDDKWRIMICQYSLENGVREYVESVDVNAGQSMSYVISTLASNYCKREHLSEYELRELANRYGSYSPGNVSCFFQLGYFRPPKGNFTSTVFTIRDRHGYSRSSIPDTVPAQLDTSRNSSLIANYDFSFGLKYRFPDYTFELLWKSMGESGQFFMIGYIRNFTLSPVVSGYCGIDMGIGFVGDDTYDNQFSYNANNDVSDRDLNNGPALLPKIGLCFMSKEKVSFFIESGLLFVVGSEKFNYGGNLDVGLSYAF
jgi:hypothetical protein